MSEQQTNIRALTIHICDDCLNLRGEMCHEPECRFCRRTMAEVADYLDALLIRPRIDGIGILVDSGEPTPPATPQQPVGLVCPFCRDDDFDAVGLKLHLTTYCEAYASVEVGNRVY